MVEVKKSRRYVRLRQLIGNPNASPPVPGILPVSAATVWRMVLRGAFPKPVKLGPRMTAWSVDAIDEWLKGREGAP